MAVIPMYYHYDECGTPCASVDIDVCGSPVRVDYFHVHRDGVDLVFVSHPCFYEVCGNIYQGSTMDVTWRGALLSQAGIEAVWHVPCGGFPYGDESLVYIANDWHTALLPVYLRAFYQEHMKLGFARSVLIVHNIAHQGRTGCDDVWRLGLPEHHLGAFHLDDPMVRNQLMYCRQDRSPLLFFLATAPDAFSCKPHVCGSQRGCEPTRCFV